MSSSATVMLQYFWLLVILDKSFWTRVVVQVAGVNFHGDANLEVHRLRLPT